MSAVSLSSWIGKRYESKGYALFIAFLTFLLITFVVLILVALVKVISQALNADQILVLGLLIAFVFGYMMFGGANSMVYTNTIQAIIMVLVAIILTGQLLLTKTKYVRSILLLKQKALCWMRI